MTRAQLNQAFGKHFVNYLKQRFGKSQNKDIRGVQWNLESFPTFDNQIYAIVFLFRPVLYVC